MYAFLNTTGYPLFIGGMTLIASVAFIDDVCSLSPRFRFFVQFVAMFLLLQEAGKQGLVFTAYHDTGCLHHQCLQLHGRNQRYDRSIQSDGIVHFLAAQQGNGFHRCHIDRIADDIRFGILLL